jgi:O-antigen/teichoic acid export membrane protein
MKGIHISDYKKYLTYEFYKQPNQNLSEERNRRIIITGISGLLVKFVSLGINLISVPLTLSYLGAEQYGIWMSITSILIFMNFADLGLGNGLLNEIANSKANKSEIQAKKAVSSTFFILALISVFLLIIFCIFSYFIDWNVFFKIKNTILNNEVHQTLIVVFVIFLFNLPLGIIQRIQEGYQEGYKYQFFLIIGSLLSFLGILISVNFKLSLPWLVLLFSSGQLLATLFNGYLLFYKNKKYLIPRYKNFDILVGKKIIRRGIVFFILGLFTLIGNSSDNLVIAKLLGFSSIASYEVVKKMFLFSTLSQLLIQPLWPAFAEAIASGDLKWAKNTLNKALLSTMLSCAIFTLPLLLFGKTIIHAWVGDKVRVDFMLLLGYYLFGIFSNYGGVMSTLLNSGPLLNKQIPIIIFSSITSVLFKFLLIPTMGVSGAIWGTLIAYLLFYTVPTYLISKRFFNLNFNLNS